MTIDYNCDPCTEPSCEALMLTDDKLFKRFLIRVLCAIKSLVGGGGVPGGATEATLLTLNAKVVHADTSNVTITAMPPVSIPAGIATEATLANIDGNITKADTDNVTIVGMPTPGLAVGAATSALQTTGNNYLSSIDVKLPIPFAGRYDEALAGVSYKGEALPGSVETDPVWRIKKITEVSSDLTIEWADGNASFDNRWDQRTILAYA